MEGTSSTTGSLWSDCHLITRDPKIDPRHLYSIKVTSAGAGGPSRRHRGPPAVLAPSPKHSASLEFPLGADAASEGSAYVPVALLRQQRHAALGCFNHLPGGETFTSNRLSSLVGPFGQTF